MMIEAIDEESLTEVLPLIRGYQAFYAIADIDDDKNRAFFAQFGASSDKGCLFGYRKDGKLVAFATVYFSYASSIISKVAVMNDLFTAEEYRREGIGTALIEHCAHYAKTAGAARLQWVTAPGNKTAQSIYEALGAKRSSWEFYTYAP